MDAGGPKAVERRERDRHDKSGAAAGSSALFGLAHLDPALIGPAFVSGFVFAWAYWRTGFLWPVVLAHVARNAVALAMVERL